MRATQAMGKMFPVSFDLQRCSFSYKFCSGYEVLVAEEDSVAGFATWQAQAVSHSSLKATADKTFRFVEEPVVADVPENTSVAPMSSDGVSEVQARRSRWLLVVV